ncbi:CHASE domain-containing protein [Methylobacterium sp. C33D]
MSSNRTGSRVPEVVSGPGSLSFLGRSARIPAPHVAALTLAVLGVLVALGAARWTQAWNARVASERIQAAASRVASLIERRVARYEYGVRGARGAIVATIRTGASREDFRRYAATRDIAKEFPGARGFGFVRRVPAAKEAAYTSAARTDGAPDFRVQQLAPHDGERWVIEFIEPHALNREAIGLDIASEPHRRGAALRAMETGLATLTAPITLVQATGMRERGFLLFLPVLRPEVPAATPDERRAATMGWTYAALVIDEVLAGLDIAPDELDIAIKDVSPDASVRFYADSSGETGPTAQPAATQQFSVYGRTWEVDVAARPAFVAGLHLVSPVSMAARLLVGTLLLSGLVHLRLAGRRRDVLAALEKARLAAIVENADDAIVGETIDGVVTDWNPAAERLFGHCAADAVGRRATDLFVPAHLRDEEREALACVERGEAVPAFRTLRMRKDGCVFPALVTVSPIRTPDGSVAGISAVTRDVSEQAAAEERIQAANASLEVQVAERTAAFHAGSALQRAILNHAGYAVIATDMRGTITLFNPAAERLLGYGADEMVGRTSPAVFHDVAEVTDRARVLSLDLGRPIEPGFEVFVAKARSGQPDPREWTYVTKGGARRPVLLNVSLLLAEDGRELGFLGIAMDLSERRRHAAEMQAAQAGTWSYDVGTGRALFSAECARQHGLPADDVELDVEREWKPLAHPDDVGHVLADLARAVETGGGYTTEFRVPLAEGGTRWITAIGRVEADASGTIVRVIGLTLDITARKEAEIALAEAKATAERARAEAERANQAKTDFLASMSHEVRTPLNAVIGFTDLMLASGRLDAVARRQAEMVRSSGAALLTVVNDILDFSKVEAGAVELVERPFPLASLAEDSAAMVRALADAKGLEVRTHIDDGLPGWVLGDGNRLRQVLLNLLNNAVKFTEAGSVTLSVAPERGVMADDRVRFSVVDTGIGIPADKQHRLFQRFSQVDGSIHRDYGGTGLGLAICKRLIELMAGEIGFSSVDGAGSTFWFTLRLPRAAEPRPQASQPLAPSRCRPGRLLLVDDSEINREVAQAVLRDAGHSVETAGDGEAAVRAVRERAFDLVLMDVQMPGMDGMTATRLIRGLPGPEARLPVIAMTANVLPEQVAAFREAGMDDHVGKPFDRDGLHAALERWLPHGPRSKEETPVGSAAPPDEGGMPFDEAAYREVLKYLPPPRNREILRILVNELDAAFLGSVDGEADRALLRRRGHSLASAAGMIGFRDLAAACRELEGFDERRVAAEGPDAFATVLGKVRLTAGRSARIAERLMEAVPDGFGLERACGRG